MPENRTPRRVDLLVTGAAEVVTCAAGAADLVGSLTGGPGVGVAVDAGEVVAVGDLSGFTGTRTLDARGGTVLPGFVDAHTHVVFGGDRVQEYAATAAGRPVPDGAPRGIVGTTALTRACSAEDLAEQAAALLRPMLASGTTTVESQSGYGLRPDAERHILEASRALDRRADLGLEVVSTHLGAHAFPADIDPAAYVDQVVDEGAEVAEAGLADFCDVYCDEGYFDLAQTERILRAGVEHGLPAKLHLDAYSHTGAADLAIELGAVSVDHLNLTTDDEVRRLAAAGIPAVYLPCLEYAVAHPFPVPARRFAGLGLELALATDVCPGCWSTSMPLAIAMACRSGGLSPQQAVRAATLGSARALGRGDRIGSLEPGKRADLVVLDVPSHEHLAYRLSGVRATAVVQAGRVVQEVAP